MFALLLAVFLGYRAWRYRTEALGRTFLALMLALAWWSFSVVMEHLSSSDLSLKIFWMKASYLGITSIPVGWLIFALKYTDKAKWSNRRNMVAMTVVAFAHVGGRLDQRLAPPDVERHMAGQNRVASRRRGHSRHVVLGQRSVCLRATVPWHCVPSGGFSEIVGHLPETSGNYWSWRPSFPGWEISCTSGGYRSVQERSIQRLLLLR